MIAARGLVKEFVVAVQPPSVKRLLLSFGQRERRVVRALNGLDLEMAAGETVALIGRNGSGKSTFLGLVGRIYRPTAGKLEVRGRVSPLLELGAGFHSDLTGRENVLLNGVILGLSRAQVAARFDQIVAFAGLEEKIDAPIRTYSSGQVMRLGFSVAVHTDAEILLVDEVLAVGDEAFQEQCYARIREFQAQGRTIVFVSHDMRAVERVAQRAIWLERGRVRADGPAAEVARRYLEEAHALAPAPG
ncbi:MAG: ABC transporter ATP-binding protein [Armatimonadetes bacterium]|nr:ABC transporter ATP-binding protein [Armatimonadota bacterium]